MAKSPAAGAPAPYRLGILLVHGIGSQPQRETLVRWGDALLEVLAAARRPDSAGEGEAGGEPLLRVRVEEARAGSGTAEEPAEATVVLRGPDGGEERWLLTEGWWADAFPPPTYRELVSWSVRAAPWSIALHVAQRYWQSRRRGAGWTRRWALARAVVEVLLALALSPLLVALLAAMLLVGLLPVPQLRSLMLAVQSTLTATVGDSLAFVGSPLRAALVRSRVGDALARLEGRCLHTVVAHSQGAAVALDALGGMDDAAGEEAPAAAPAEAPDTAARCTLITLGAGVNKLVALREARRFDEQKEGNPVTRALAALLASGAVAGWLLLTYLAGSLDGTALLRSAAALVAVLVGVGLLRGLVEWVLRRLSPEVRDSRWLPRGLALGIVALAVVVYQAAERMAPALWPLYFLAVSVGMLAFAVWSLLRPQTEARLAAGVRRPPGIRHWVDLYASADPVPNGPLCVRDGTAIESVRVWNEGSTLADHTAYWANRDELVLRVARECAAAAGSPWASSLPLPPAAAAGAASRPALRVRDLLRARWLNRLLWLGVLALGWSTFRELIPLPVELPAAGPAWLRGALRVLLLVACAAAAILATSTLLRWPWRRWVRFEQEAVLAGRTPADRRWYALAGMGLVSSLPVSLALLLFEAGRRGVPLGEWGRATADRLLAGGASVWWEIAFGSFFVLLLLGATASIFAALLLGWSALSELLASPPATTQEEERR